MSSVFDCPVVELSKIHSRKGNITIVENDGLYPFNVKRIYYLYDVPSGESRGGHGHKRLYQFLIAASGAFDVILDDGTVKKTVTLNQPNKALLIVPGIWRELINFSSGSICLVLASEFYDEGEYLRDYNEFITFKNGI